MPAMETAAIVAAVALAIVNVWQLALAFGAPASFAAWGGWHEGKLPPRLRLASGVLGFVFYPLVIVFVLDAGGLIDTNLMSRDTSVLWLWILVGVFAVGTVMNLASRSKRDRLWSIPSAVIAVCIALIAISL